MTSFQILEFLKLNPLFGPLTSIIKIQIVEALRFLVLLFLFMLGFTMLIMALNTPYKITEGLNHNQISKTSINEELKRSNVI